MKNPGNLKIPRIGIRNHEKSQVRNSENPKILGIGIGIWKPRKNPENISSAKSQNPGDLDFCSRDSRFLSLGILIPGIRDFSEYRDFSFPGSGFFVGWNWKSKIWLKLYIYLNFLKSSYTRDFQLYSEDMQNSSSHWETIIQCYSNA